MDSFCTFYYFACGATSAFKDILFALMNIALNLTCVTGFVLTYQLITMLMSVVSVSLNFTLRIYFLSFYLLAGVKVGIMGMSPLTK